MSDNGSLAGLPEAAALSDVASDTGSFAAGPRDAGDTHAQTGDPPRRPFRAQPHHGQSMPSVRNPDEDAHSRFIIRPPPDSVDVLAANVVPLEDNGDSELKSPPSSNEAFEFDTALLRQRIEARHQLHSVSPQRSSSGSSVASTAFAGLTRLIDNNSDGSEVSRSYRTRGHGRGRYSGPLGKRQRLVDVPEDDEDGQSAVSGMFGREGHRAGPLIAPGATWDTNSAPDSDLGDAYAGDDLAGSIPETARPPSSIHSDPPEEYNGDHNTSDDTAEKAMESSQSRSSVGSEFVRPRPRDPMEPEPPVVFEVPVAMMPEIDWLSVALDADGQILEQRLEHSESESDSNESMGSVAEMIESDSETEAESDGNAEWQPQKPYTADATAEGSSSDQQSSDSDAFVAASVSESDDSDFTPDVELQVVEAGSRNDRQKRHRIPTVKWWLGERIQYEADGPLGTFTAVDVRRVEPEKKVYRRRRPYRRRRGPLLPREGEDEAEAERQAVHAPVLDVNGGKFRERTVARSINGLDFGPMRYIDGSTMPLVSRCAIFGGTTAAPVQLYVVRIEPGAIYTYEADVSKVCTFVVWRGRCVAKMNRTEFSLQKGMACIVPPGNDLYVDNGNSVDGEARRLGEDVFFFVTEINARDSPELAAAMTRDAQSVVSGAATFSRLFQMDRSDDINEGAASFVSGLHHFGRQRADDTPGRTGQEENGSGAGASEPLDEGRASYDEYDGGGGYGDVLPSDLDTTNGDDDALSVAPSIFRDLQEDGEDRATKARNARSLSFQIGRGDQVLKPRSAPIVANPKAPDSDFSVPSFHLERGSRSLPGQLLRAEGLAFQMHKEHRELHLQRRLLQRADSIRVPINDEQAPARVSALGSTDDEIENFFAEVGEQLVDDDFVRVASPTLERQEVLHRVLNTVRPPSHEIDTHTSVSTSDRSDERQDD